MNQQEFSKLETGDLIINFDQKECCVVTANYGDRVTAVRTIDITNPREWGFVSKPYFFSEKAESILTISKLKTALEGIIGIKTKEDLIAVAGVIPPIPTTDKRMDAARNAINVLIDLAEE